MILDLLTSLFAGAMIPLLPFLLLRTVEIDKGHWRVFAWVVLAAVAWLLAVYLSFALPWAGLIGIVIGAALWWKASRKPQIISHVVEEDISHSAEENPSSEPHTAEESPPSKS